MEAKTGDWTLVTRRKPYPSHWSRSPAVLPVTKPYQPFFTKPSYSQVVQSNIPTTMATTKNPRSTTSSQHNSRPTTPSSPKTISYYISPHSPTTLRFPPSTQFTEWRGRCFRCCRTGHSAAACRNQKRCGKCWGEGHIGAYCPKEIVSPCASEFVPRISGRGEPSFDEFLTGPLISKPLPEGRPAIAYCYLEKDEEYYKEVEKLQGAIVVSYKPECGDFSIDQIAQFLEKTNLITKDDLSISIISNSKFLVLLPHGFAPGDLISAIPAYIWHKGLTFSLWSPLDGATVKMPRYKIMIDILGIPPHLYREKSVIRAASIFGTYLGTVEQQKVGDLTRWTIVVATEDLAKIPRQVGYVVGGFETVVDLNPITWKHAPVYSANEIPKQPQVFNPPFVDEDELFTVSRKDLREICRGRVPNELPSAIKAVLTGESTVNTIDEARMATEIPIATEDQSVNHAADREVNSQVEFENIDTDAQINIVGQHSEGSDPLYFTSIVGASTDPIETNYMQSSPISEATDFEAVISQDGIDKMVTSTVIQENVLNSDLCGNCESGDQVVSILHMENMKDQSAENRDVNIVFIQNPDCGRENQVVTSHISMENDSSHNRLRRISVEDPHIESFSPNFQAAPNPPRPNLVDHNKVALDRAKRGKGVIAAPKVFERNKRAKTVTFSEGENRRLPAASTIKAQKQPITAIRGVTKNGPKQKGFARLNSVYARSAHASSSKNNTPSSVKNKARLCTNKDGLIQVKVNYEYSTKLAESWGVSTDLVSQALEDDNAQRLSQQTRENMQLEGEHINLNFDPDTEDELSSESD